MKRRHRELLNDGRDLAVREHDGRFSDDVHTADLARHFIRRSSQFQDVAAELDDGPCQLCNDTGRAIVPVVTHDERHNTYRRSGFRAADPCPSCSRSAQLVAKLRAQRRIER